MANKRDIQVKIEEASIKPDFLKEQLKNINSNMQFNFYQDKA